jgi:hypothetical protein
MGPGRKQGLTPYFSRPFRQSHPWKPIAISCNRYMYSTYLNIIITMFHGLVGINIFWFDLILKMYLPKYWRNPGWRMTNLISNTFIKAIFQKVVTRSQKCLWFQFGTIRGRCVLASLTLINKLIFQLHLLTLYCRPKLTPQNTNWTVSK